MRFTNKSFKRRLSRRKKQRRQRTRRLRQRGGFFPDRLDLRPEAVKTIPLKEAEETAGEAPTKDLLV